MIRRALGVFSLLIVPFLIMGAAPQPSVLSAKVQMVQRALEQIQQAKPGQEVGFPELFRGAVRNVPVPGVAMAPGNEPILSLLVRSTDGGSALQSAGFEVGTTAGEVSVITAPLSRLRELAALPGVLQVEMVRPVKPLLDVSVAEIGASDVHGAAVPPYPGTGATGKGVVVGIVDSGVDVTHGDFKNADGTSRISFLWDQNDGGGPGPAEFPCTGGASGRSWCGTQWTAAQIDASQSRQTDVVGHGTHVAGAAAGNGRATSPTGSQFTYVGVAPDAEIVAVNTNFLDGGIIEGVDYVMRRAGSKPCVVNLSLGSQFGPHDGTDLFDLAMDGLSGPGRIIVAASGNEGDEPIHGEVVVPAGQSANVTFSIGARNPQSGLQNDVVWMEAWYPGNANLSFRIVGPGGGSVGPIGLGGDSAINTTDGTLWVSNATTTTNNGDRLADLVLYDGSSAVPTAGNWRIEVTNASGTAAEVDLWIGQNTLVGPSGSVEVGFTGDALEFAELVGSPASSNSSIAVGAYVTKRRWMASTGQTLGYVGLTDEDLGSIADFSSMGPRRDGALKPEITAPGMGIASAVSFDANPTGDPQRLLTDGIHTINQGTSMACPHISGVVALILQRHPNYDRPAVMTALTATARNDAHTGTVPNNLFGFGKVDAQAAADYLTPVRLLSLSAVMEDARPVVRWSLAQNEPGTLFHIERGATRDGSFSRVSETLVGEGPFAWTDADPSAAEPWYRVFATLRGGGIEVFGPVQVERVTGPAKLLQNAPNPFRSATTVAFTLDRPGPARLEILDVQGRRVRLLADRQFGEGRHDLEWDGATEGGRDAASGVYFTRLTTSNEVQVRRMVLAP